MNSDSTPTAAPSGRLSTRLLGIALASAVVVGGAFVVPPAAHAEIFYPSASWDVSSIGVDLVANGDGDLLARPQARLTLAWDNASPGQSDLCVAYSIDDGVAAKKLAISSTAETRTTDSRVQVGATTGRTLTTVHTWTELVNEYALDTTVAHTLTVTVLDEQCPGDVPAGGGNEPFSVAVLTIPAGAADAQDVDLNLSSSLVETAGNTVKSPTQGVGDDATADNWIYPGESATFGRQETRVYDQLWDGPLVHEGAEISGICEVYFVNLDDGTAAPDASNAAQGYDLVYSGVTWGAAVARQNGSADKTHSNPRAQSTSAPFSWSTLIASGYRGWTFDPSKVNSITRMIFAGGCWDGAYVASGSSTDSTVPVNPAVNYSSSLRNISQFGAVNHFYKWDYWAHPVAGASDARFYTDRASALATETLYLGPAELSIGLSDTEIGPGESVDYDATWFDGSSCVAVYVDGVFFASEPAGTPGTAGSTTALSTTWEQAIAGYSLDPSVEHTVTFAIFAGACADVDESVDTPADSSSVLLRPIVPSAGFVSPTASRGEGVDLDLEWADPAQCAALFIDDEFVESFAAGGTTKTYGTSSEEFSWDTVMADYGLDWSVEHTVMVRLYDSSDAGCAAGTAVFSSDETVDPATDETVLRLLPVVPNLDVAQPKVGPDESTDVTIDRDAYGDLAAAQYIDGKFVGCFAVSEIPTSVSWDDLDDSYSRDAEHTVTFAVYPFAAGVLCDESSFVGVTPLTEVDVVLQLGPGGGALAATGASAAAPAALLASVLALVLGAALVMVTRRRRRSA